MELIMTQAVIFRVVHVIDSQDDLQIRPLTGNIPRRFLQSFCFIYRNFHKQTIIHFVLKVISPL